MQLNSLVRQFKCIARLSRHSDAPLRKLPHGQTRHRDINLDCNRAQSDSQPVEMNIRDKSMLATVWGVDVGIYILVSMFIGTRGIFDKINDLVHSLSCELV